MERDICPIAVLYFAVKRSFCNVEKLFCWSTRVRMSPHFVSRDVIGHVTIRSAVGGFLSIDINHVSRTVFDILSLKHFGVMTLTVWGHVTSSAT